MVALAILSTTLVVLLRIVTNNVRATNHAKMTTAATFLARTKMVEVEDSILYDGFIETNEFKNGTFKTDGYPQFRWDTSIERIELPTNLAQQTQDEARAARDSDKTKGDPMAMMSGFLGGMMSTFIEPIRIGLQESVRKVTVRVSWDEVGRRDQSFEVVQYLTDPAKLDLALTGGGAGAGPAPRARRRRAARRGRPGMPGVPGHARGMPARAWWAMMTRRRTDSGFTLIEVLLALAIFAFVTTIMLGSFTQTAKSKRAIQSAQERTHTVRVALTRMTREIEMAYLSSSENMGLTNRRTLLIGSTRADVDELMFSTFAHQRLRAGAAEGDTSIVSYFGERDPDDRRVLNLMRRETRRLQAEDPNLLIGESYVLCPDVSRVKISYYDHKRKEWTDRLEHAERQRAAIPADAHPHHADGVR